MAAPGLYVVQHFPREALPLSRRALEALFVAIELRAPSAFFRFPHDLDALRERVWVGFTSLSPASKHMVLAVAKQFAGSAA